MRTKIFEAIKRFILNVLALKTRYHYKPNRFRGSYFYKNWRIQTTSGFFFFLITLGRVVFNESLELKLHDHSSLGVIFNIYYNFQKALHFL